MQDASPLSLAEAQALEELDAYGFGFAAVYIGRARRHFADLNQNPSAAQIVDQVFALSAADENAQAFVEISTEDARNYTRLRGLDFEATRDLINLLRETVELERGKRPAKVFGEPGSKIRLTLYPDTKPGKAKLFTRLAQLGQNRCLLKAELGRNAEFINLEITLT